MIVCTLSAWLGVRPFNYKYFCMQAQCSVYVQFYTVLPNTKKKIFAEHIFAEINAVKKHKFSPLLYKHPIIHLNEVGIERRFYWSIPICVKTNFLYLYQLRYLSQEAAKRDFVVRLQPGLSSTAHAEVFSLSLLMLNVVPRNCEYQLYGL